MSKKISWNQFKIKDLKPNLVENGWDSFVPYGNEGKPQKAPLEVFEAGYVPNELKNGDFRKGMEHWSFDSPINYHMVKGNGVEYSTDTTYVFLKTEYNLKDGHRYYLSGTFTGVNKRLLKWFGNQRNRPLLEKGDYNNEPFSNVFTMGGNDDFTINTYDNTDETRKERSWLGNLYLVDLTKTFGKGNEPSKQWCDENFNYWANWSDLPSEQLVVPAWDNMAILKTPLGNGFTRIQTWGGNHTHKLQFVGQSNENITYSFYAINNGNNPLRAITYYPYTTHNINVGEEWYLNDTKDNKDGEVLLRISTIDGSRTSDSLDFIVSEPQIVEGNEPNPTLVVKELDDGREHVKVYGATPETTLVYDEAGFKGELYSFNTEIENQGTHMKMTSTIGDYNEEIKDGVTEIKHEGNLRTPRIEIELGASDE